jgi:hypothetical protein
MHFTYRLACEHLDTITSHTQPVAQPLPSCRFDLVFSLHLAHSPLDNHYQSATTDRPSDQQHEMTTKMTLSREGTLIVYTLAWLAAYLIKPTMAVWPDPTAVPGSLLLG